MYRGTTRLSWGADKGVPHSIDRVIARAEPGISRGLYAEGEGGRVLSCARAVAENIADCCSAQVRWLGTQTGFARDGRRRIPQQSCGPIQRMKRRW